MRVLEGENGLSLVCAPSLQAEGAAGGHRSGREGSGAPAQGQLREESQGPHGGSRGSGGGPSPTGSRGGLRGEEATASGLTGEQTQEPA